MSYVETIAELPWSKLSQDNLDLDQAQKILDRDHYDLEKVKRRLIEYLAVRKLNPQGHGPILCFLGPPGVGKTSLGQSIADALGRKFVRSGWAVSGTRRRFADIAALTLLRCRAASSKSCAGQGRAIP